ncbi:MAG: sensor domain-containing diguanylate cyclase [Clostridiales bacterium]|nr:sensor domain-containing diguanylate cyclase [Clostridiales bacterium]
MNYDLIADSFEQLACVLSVDLTKEHGAERFVIESANEKYKRSVVEDPADFTPHVPYTRYITRDKNFEGMCLQCVASAHPVHAYVDAEFYNAWMDIYMLPLRSDDPTKGYCLFSYDLSPKADAEKMSDISAATAMHVLKTCIKLRETDDFQAAMESVIADIREICDASRCCILLTDFTKRTCSVLCEDYVDHVNELPMTAYADEHFFDIVETWPNLIAGSNCFIISNEADMEAANAVSPIWVESLRGAGVYKLVIYPLRSNGETIGYIWANNFDTERTLMIKEILEVTTFLLSAEIANHQMFRQMQILSSTDLLTGVLNRNAMNNRILDIDSGVRPIKMPFSILFVDVNGLKTTNDSQGHIAGDTLLKDVASTLSEIYKDHEVYRVGGDEFMVIVSGGSEEEYRELEKTLLANSERPGRAHYAAGSCYSSETKDIRKAMHLADERMYDIKQEYYKRHPESAWDRYHS